MSISTLEATLDPIALRNAMGKFASGVTIVTSHDGVEPLGFTCQSFYSVSLEPPLISICVMKTSSTYPRIRETGHFVVNVLQQSQKELSGQFARRGTDKWAGVAWKPSGLGAPVLKESLLWVECRIQVEHDAGDHILILGEVLSVGGVEQENLHDPLVFFKGNYRSLK